MQFGRGEVGLKTVYAFIKIFICFGKEFEYLPVKKTLILDLAVVLIWAWFNISIRIARLAYNPPVCKTSGVLIYADLNGIKGLFIGCAYNWISRGMVCDKNYNHTKRLIKNIPPRHCSQTIYLTLLPQDSYACAVNRPMNKICLLRRFLCRFCSVPIGEYRWVLLRISFYLKHIILTMCQSAGPFWRVQHCINCADTRLS